MTRKKFRTNWLYIFVLVILALIFWAFSSRQLKNWPEENFSEIKTKKAERIEITEELINKIIDKILPENFDRKTACYFLSDLNKDGISEIIVGFIKNPPTQNAYLAIVTPIDENFEKLADFNFGQKEDITFSSSPCLRDKKDILDVNGDGKEEMVLDLGAGGASNEAFGIFEIDLQAGKIEWLKIKEKDGEIKNSFFLKGGSVMHQEDFELKDLDGDGKMEIIEKEGEYLGGDWEKKESWKWQISVYKWDGKIFKYNEKLSEEVLEK